MRGDEIVHYFPPPIVVDFRKGAQTFGFAFRGATFLG
jgi:hypothetical protein